MIPVAAHLHEFAPGSIHDNPNRGLDLKLKQMAQTYFEEHYGIDAVKGEIASGAETGRK